MKITKLASKLHDEAMAILSLSRKLERSEIEMVFEQYNPMADHNVGQAGIFFTPTQIALEIQMPTQLFGSVVDIAAGIGKLTYYVWMHADIRKRIGRFVCIDNNPVFVEIGKKLLPDVEWYCFDIYQKSLWEQLGTFHFVISNPPYGNVAMDKTDWLLPGPADQKAIEIALRVSKHGGPFILPISYSNRDDRKFIKLRNKFGKFCLTEWASSIYEDAEWQGANPNTRIYDLDFSDIENTPYGLQP